jgi:hypothetical protein
VTGFGQTHFSDSLSEHFFRILSVFERLTSASHPLSSHSVSIGIFTHIGAASTSAIWLRGIRQRPVSGKAGLTEGRWRMFFMTAQTNGSLSSRSPHTTPGASPRNASKNGAHKVQRGSKIKRRPLVLCHKRSIAILSKYGSLDSAFRRGDRDDVQTQKAAKHRCFQIFRLLHLLRLMLF